jgi:hypothetical protein
LAAFNVLIRFSLTIVKQLFLPINSTGRRAATTNLPMGIYIVIHYLYVPITILRWVAFTSGVAQDGKRNRFQEKNTRVKQKTKQNQNTILSWINRVEILTPIYRHSIHFKDNVLWLTENRINNIYLQYDSYEYTMYVYCNL